MAFHSSSFGILLLTLFVALLQFNNASFISDACGKAADFDANINHDFCVNSLQPDPKSASANFHGLVQITMNLAIENVMTTLSRINYLLSKPVYAHLKSELSECQGDYSDAKDALLDAVKRINASHDEALWALTAAMTAMDTCEDENTDKSILGKRHADGLALRNGNDLHEQGCFSLNLFIYA